MANRPSRLVVPAYSPSYDGRYHLKYAHGDKPVSGAELVAGASVSATAAASITAAIRMAAQAKAQAAASSGLSTAIRLAANAAARASASGTLPVSGGGFVARSGYTVTAIEGSFGDGKLVRIEKVGGGLGSKPNGSKALHVIPHQTGKTQHSTWSRSTSGIVQDNGVWVTSGSAPILQGSSGYTRTDMTVYSNVAWPGISFGSGKLLRVVKFYMNWNWLSGPVTNLKFSRIWAADGTNDLIVGVSSEGGFGPKLYCEMTDGFPGSPNQDINFVPQQGAWYTMELLFSPSSANGVRDAETHIFLNALRMTPSNGRLITRSSSYPTALSVNYGPQISNNEEPAGSYIYTGLDYSDDGWCSVFISNESSYQNVSNGSGTAYLREYCPISSWADGATEAWIRYGERTSLTGTRIFVRDNNGNVAIAADWQD